MENKSTNAKWRKIQNVNKAVTEGDLTVGPADGLAKVARLRNMANGSPVDTPYELGVQINPLNNPVDGGIAELKAASTVSPALGSPVNTAEKLRAQVRHTGPIDGIAEQIESHKRSARHPSKNYNATTFSDNKI